MKIAVLYSGLSSYNHELFENHYKHILEPYSPDVFISTYDSDSIEDIIKNYKPKNIQIENYKNIEPYFEKLSSFIRFNYPETRVVNSISMFYKIHRAFCLIEDSSDYDIIIRNRFDISFDQILKPEINQSINIPLGGDHRGGLMDMFAYGNYDNMFIYSNLILVAGCYLAYNNIAFHPESLLRMHCQINNLDIRRFDYNIYLRGSCFTKSAPTYY